MTGALPQPKPLTPLSQILSLGGLSAEGPSKHQCLTSMGSSTPLLQRRSRGPSSAAHAATLSPIRGATPPSAYVAPHLRPRPPRSARCLVLRGSQRPFGTSRASDRLFSVQGSHLAGGGHREHAGGGN
ncbi:hypothetical protein NDU88_009081 [Pleurodeles waltl]|uniref:Uncharacterized protein n=1 Tax=Pleurodeles waltl TaxID=8319 RepID=A0AAV7PR32_PLEWA|nr:hypothetical protein NDU88_009081 [Pleurodeles waltl]